MRRCTVACPALTTALCYVSIAATVGIAGIAEDFEASRVRTITGSVLDGETDVRLELKAASMRDGAKCVYGVKAANGRFSQAVKLFPGLNVPTAETATGVDQKLIRFSVKKPSLRVQLSWAGNNQDYDLHVNEVFYGNKISGGGTLDHDWIDNDSDGNPVENITYAAAEAGLYRIYVYYYDDNEYDEDGEQVGSPQTTTVRIYVNGKQIYSGSRLITEHNGDGTGDGKSIWNIGTVVLHSGDGAGGYAADGRRLDLAGQGGLKGVSPLTTFSAEDIAGPNEKDPVYLCVGDAAQFNATGTLNSGSGNEQPDTEIIEKFTSTDEAVGTIDALGVFVAKAPGHTQISCEGYSATPIDVYVVKVDLVQWVTLDGNTPIENCPKNGGKRIFPDKQTPTDDNASTRKKVVVRAKVSPAVEGQAVHFRVIDVDDPSEDTQYVDKNDAAGPTGADNLGTGHSLSAEYAQTDASGFASVEFMVSMQPGDNFKVLASLDGSMLNSVEQTEVDDGSVPEGIVQSEMLTVWRRLWFEFDSMATWPSTGEEKNFETGTIVGIQNNVPVAGESTLQLDVRLLDESDRYENGKIIIDGLGPYPVVSNSDNLLLNDTVVISSVPPTNIVVGKSFTLYDDDDISFGLRSPRRMPYAISGGSLLNTAFADAYIEPEPVPYSTWDADIPFIRNLNSDLYNGTYWSEWLPTVSHSRDYGESEDFWYIYVVAAFQPEASADCDPGSWSDDIIFGQAEYLSTARRAVVFMETIREFEINPMFPRICEEHNIVHEIGHLGGGEHDDMGIMTDGAPITANNFTPITIMRFRSNTVY